MSERRIPNPDNPGGPLIAADDALLTREMATMLIAFKRFSDAQIAKQLGIPEESVRALRDDPEVQEAILNLSEILPRPGQIHELLMSDAERNVRWLRNLREGLVDGRRLDPENDKLLGHRTKAATVLLERQVAKKVEVAPPTVRTIELTPTQREMLNSVLGGAPTLAIEAQEAKAADETRPPPQTIFMDGDFDG